MANPRSLLGTLVGLLASLVVAACGSSSKTAGPTTTTTPSVVLAAGQSEPLQPAPALPIQPGFRPVGASFISPAEGWVLGRAQCDGAACTQVLHTIDAGAHWSAVSAPPAPLAASASSAADPTAVSAIDFTSKLDGWVWGPALYATHDGGATWHHVAARPVLALDAASGTAWAIVTGCDDPAGCQRLELQSSSTANDLWSPTKDAISSSNPMVDLSAQATHRWVLAGGVVYEAATGDPLTALTAPCDDPSAPDGLMTSNDEQVVVACGPASNATSAVSGVPEEAASSTTIAGASATRLTISDDAGGHWSTPFQAPSPLAAFAANGDGVLVAASNTSRPTLSRSTDGGQTWSTTETVDDPGGSWTSLTFLSANDAVAVLEDSTMWASHDGGASWTELSFGR